MDKVLTLIREDTGSDEVRVDNPTQNLESLFLNIVEQARQKESETSGATSGHRVAEYLRGDAAGERADRVLDHLTRATDKPALGQAPEVTKPTETVDVDKLAGLAKAEPALASRCRSEEGGEPRQGQREAGRPARRLTSPPQTKRYVAHCQADFESRHPVPVCRGAWRLTLLVIVFGIPLLLKSDGTAKGTVQLVLTYTLGSTTALLGIASLWMGCGTLAREIEDNVMQMVAVKPVARWRVWLGKWLGIMLLNAALMVPTGLAIFFLINARANSSELERVRKGQAAKRGTGVAQQRPRAENGIFRFRARGRMTTHCWWPRGKAQYTEKEQALRKCQ